eukprot:768710-Hanusia_phi.AAC.7
MAERDRSRQGRRNARDARLVRMSCLTVSSTSRLSRRSRCSASMPPVRLVTQGLVKSCSFTQPRTVREA